MPLGVANVQDQHLAADDEARASRDELPQLSVRLRHHDESHANLALQEVRGCKVSACLNQIEVGQMISALLNQGE